MTAVIHRCVLSSTRLLEKKSHHIFQFLFNVSRQTVVTYDDTYSLADKAAFAKQNGMAGCFTWSLDQVWSEFLQSILVVNECQTSGRWLFPAEHNPLQPGQMSLRGRLEYVGYLVNHFVSFTTSHDHFTVPGYYIATHPVPIVFTACLSIHALPSTEIFVVKNLYMTHSLIRNKANRSVCPRETVSIIGFLMPTGQIVDVNLTLSLLSAYRYANYAVIRTLKNNPG